MSNVWKVGSRWSKHGSPESSIIDIFRKHNVVFIGDNRDRFLNAVKPHDYIAIADGFKIYILSKVISEPKPITEFGIQFSEEELQRFDYDDWVVGVQVHIVEIGDRSFSYKKMGSFFKANSIARKVENLYEEENKRFEITASTSYLFRKNYRDNLLSPKLSYVIPIYQRPYSWGKEQIEKLMTDLFLGFSDGGKIINDDVFLGTIQLSYPRYLDKESYSKQLIDGQQRFTTFLIVFKVLSLMADRTENKLPVGWNWLSTEVNNYSQQEKLNELKRIDSIQDLKNLLAIYAQGKSVSVLNNKYIENALIVLEKLEEFFEDEQIISLNPNVDLKGVFLQYVLNNVCFVTIQTKAPLSKTLKIFDAINTTGLDLGGNDVFKIRFYEYLRTKGANENIFENISDLYKKIEDARDNNISFGMWEILLNYQWIIIAKNDLSSTLYDLSPHTFFEQLFDVMLGLGKYPNFEKTKLESVKVELVDLENLILNRIEWEKNFPVHFHASVFYCIQLLKLWSRYSRYWQLAVLYQNFGEKQQLGTFISEMKKTLVVYSILYDKSIYSIHSFLRSQIIPCIVKEEPFTVLIKKLQAKREEVKVQFEHVVNQDIFYNAKKKNLVCRTLGFRQYVQVNELEKNIFTIPIDIEHIHSQNELVKDPSKKELWLKEQNSVGNLILLEEKINRRIKDKPFKEKLKHYDESVLSVMKSFLNDYRSKQSFDADMAKQRRKNNVAILMEYFFA